MGAVRQRGLATGLVALLVLAVFALVSRSAKPIGEIEEHFELGRQWRATGTFPAVLRPPGYPGFVALALLARDALRAAIPVISSDDKAAVLFAQGLLLVGASGLTCWYFSRAHPPTIAAATGLLLGVNPFSIILAGTLSYYWLHIVSIVAATIALAVAVERPAWRIVFVSGLSWGIATLVRPVSLVLPPFVALLFRPSGGRRGVRAAAVPVSVFILGMAAAVGPVTLRNFAATGKLIPVNAQAGFSLWGNTIEKIPSRTGYLTWTTLWTQRGLTVMKRVTGTEASQPASIEDTVRLNAEFASLALAQIRDDPGTYAHNVAINFREFNLDRLQVWPKFFARTQAGVDIGEAPPAPARAPFRAGVALANGLLVALMFLALGGVAVGIRAGDAMAGTVAVVYASMVLAHAIMFMTPRYPYVKLPLVMLAASVALAQAPVPLRVREAAGGALVLLALAATMLLIS